MRGMSDRTATVLLILTIGSTLLMCLCYLAIFIIPDMPFNPYPPQQATAWAEATLLAQAPRVESAPTKTQPTSIFGPTWTPSVTPTPTNSPTPTETRTPTPTSSPTPTVTPRPTKTPLPTATFTPSPEPPPPTSPPPPLYTVAKNQTEANCEVIRIKGKVFDSSGVPLAGVVLQVGEVNVAGSVFSTAPTDANGRYVWDFGSPGKESHTWFVVPLENGQPAVDRFTFTTDPSDVCEITSAVQIQTVDWRRRPDLQ